jgi:hypothetical protein
MTNKKKLKAPSKKGHDNMTKLANFSRPLFRTLFGCKLSALKKKPC